jgi:glycosyltransferase involved in cell wall biosynthesis
MEEINRGSNNNHGMKIGIGVTTYNRPKHLELWQKQILCDENFIVSDKIISDDSKERKGIAFRKNECLRYLKDCDYVFLFDDDCFPIKEGWAEFFINAHKFSGQHHFMYLKETPQHKQIKRHGFAPFENGYINQYNNCSGAMMFLTKECIEKVGAYDERFGNYGFEHANYSQRIHKAGLTTMGEYLCPEGASEYIYAMDFDTHLPFNKQVKHAPSMKPKEAVESIMKAQEHYSKAITEIYLPL